MKLKELFLLGLLIIFFFFFSLKSALSESLTYDEIVHSQEGINHLINHTFAIDTNNPPLARELQMTPIVLGFSGRSSIPAIKLLPARIVTIFFGCLLIFVTFLIARKFFDPWRALFAALLLAFEPTFLAHSHYVTLDMGFTLFFFLAYASFLNLNNFWQSWIIFGSSLGLAMASRVLTIPWFLAIMLFSNKKNWFRDVDNFKNKLFFTGIISLLVLWSAYFFRWDVVVAAREDSNRVSSRLAVLAKEKNFTLLSDLLWVVGNQPIPLGNYLATVKNTLLRSGEHPAYFLLFNLLFKLPIPFLIFFALGLYAGKNEKKASRFILPILIILIAASISRMMPWARYVLPIWPFMAIVGSGSIIYFKKRFSIFLFCLLLLWYLSGTLNQFPHFISYANELAGPRDQRYQKFIDSNIDWGQSLRDLAIFYQKQKPARLLFSYFGRDDAGAYGLKSDIAYGGYKSEDICAFHPVVNKEYYGQNITAISISNWYGCGYYKDEKFNANKIRDVVGDSILIFTY